LAREKKTLTDTFLKNVKPQAKRQTFMDDRGLGIWVQPMGKRLVGKTTITFFYRYTSPVTKKRTFLPLGRYGEEGVGMTLRKARLEREKLEGVLAKGDDPKTHSEHAIGTLKELAELFVKEKIINMAFQTQKTYKSALKSKVLPALGSKRFVKIKQSDIIRLLDSVNNNSGYEMMRQTKKVLSSLYTFAVSQKAILGIEGNLVKGIDLKPWREDKERKDRNAKKVKRWLRLEEIKRFWDYLEQHAGDINDSYCRLWKIVLITGCRPIEAVGMKWSDIGSHVLIDIDDIESIDTSRFWLRPGEIMKKGKPHLTYLSDLAMDVIEPLRGEQGNYVLWAEDKLSEKQMISRRKYGGELLKLAHGEYNKHEKKDKRKVLPVIDVDKFTPHDLRRSAATQMGNLGIPKAAISAVLSHSSLDGSAQTTEKHYNLAEYIHEKVNALNKWEQKLRKVLLG